MNHPPDPPAYLQLSEAEANYAEIYEEYEKVRALGASVCDGLPLVHHNLYTASTVMAPRSCMH